MNMYFFGGVVFVYTMDLEPMVFRTNDSILKGIPAISRWGTAAPKTPQQQPPKNHHKNTTNQYKSTFSSTMFFVLFRGRIAPAAWEV